MRNSFKEKEKTLTEERDKAIKAAEYVQHFFVRSQLVEETGYWFKVENNC